MKKIIILSLFTVSVFALLFSKADNSETFNIVWNVPEITSKSYISFLQENDESITYRPINLDRVDEYYNYFALSSWKTFFNAWKNFLVLDDGDIQHHNFLQYYIPKREIIKASATRTGSPSYNPSGACVSMLLYSGLDYMSNLDESFDFLYYGIRINGVFERKFTFYADWWKGHFAGQNDDFYQANSLLIDSWTQTNSASTETYLDNVTGRLQYEIAPWCRLAIGRGKYEIGNNIGGSIILNDDCNDYGYLTSKLHFKSFTLAFMHSSLVADSTLSGSKDFPDKYFATHKLNWQAKPDLEFFLGEHVVYGNRGIDVNYLFPFSFWRLTEHNLSDRDNVLIFAGVNWKPFEKGTCYSNIILDELSQSKLFKNWWGNKYAVQTGYSYLINYDNESRITAEFTAIRPWLYTHKYIHTKFSHDDRGLGFPAGSNLIQFTSEFDYSILENLQINLHGELTRQGSVGNDFSINYENRDKELDEDTHWLEGEITNNILGRFVCNWSPLIHHKFKLSVTLSKMDDEEISKQILFGYQARY